VGRGAGAVNSAVSTGDSFAWSSDGSGACRFREWRDAALAQGGLAQGGLVQGGLAQGGLAIGDEVTVELPGAGGGVVARVVRSGAGMVMVVFHQDASDLSRVSRAGRGNGAGKAGGGVMA
jgi:hypothetical protein